MELYKIYVMTKKKDGTVTKSEAITTKAVNKFDAIEIVTRQAKTWYGYKGKVHIGSILIRSADKRYVAI